METQENERTPAGAAESHSSLATTSSEARVSSPIDMFFAMGGVNLAVTNLGGGALGIVLGLSLRDVVLVYLIGGALGSVLIGLCVVQAKRTGASVMINSRPAFGYMANRALTALAFLMTACWFGVNNYFGVTSARSIAMRFGVPGGKRTDLIILLAVMSILILIAIFGYVLIIRYQRLTVLAMGFAILAITIGTFATGRIEWSAAGSLTGSGRLAAIVTLLAALGVGWAVSWTPYSYDFGRFLKTEASELRSWFFGWLGMFLVGGITFSVSAAITSFAGSGFDVGRTVEAVLPAGLSLIVLLVMVVGLLPANLANLLVGPAMLETLDLRLSRVVAVLATALCGLPIAVSAIYVSSFGGLFERWMLSLGTWLGPWITIVLLDFYIVSRGEYTNKDLYSKSNGSGGAFFAPGIAAWFGGLIGALLFANIPVFESPIMREYFANADASLFAGSVIAGVIYYPWATLAKRKRSRRLGSDDVPVGEVTESAVLETPGT